MASCTPTTPIHKYSRSESAVSAFRYPPEYHLHLGHFQPLATEMVVISTSPQRTTTQLHHQPTHPGSREPHCRTAPPSTGACDGEGGTGAAPQYLHWLLSTVVLPPPLLPKYAPWTQGRSTVLSQDPTVKPPPPTSRRVSSTGTATAIKLLIVGAVSAHPE